MILRILLIFLILSTAQARDKTDGFIKDRQVPRFTGQETLFVALLNFPDKVSPFSRSQFSNNIGTMCSYYNTSSYGRLTITPTITIHFYMMPHPSTYYGNWKNRNVIAADAREVLKPDYGDVLSNYSNVMYCFPPISNWGYGGYYSDRQIWINGKCGTWLFAHEMGHSQWLGHAKGWVPCNSSNAVDSCGHLVEYGDCLDMMGAYGATKDFSPAEKVWMGWMPQSKIMNVTTNGVYRIYRFDDKSAISFPVLGLSFPQPGTQKTYNVSYRYTPTGTRNGAYVQWAGNDWLPVLVDYTPATTCGNDSVVPIGGKLVDKGLEIVPLRVGGSGAERWIEVQIKVTPSPQ